MRHNRRMVEVLTLGDILVEVMRTAADQPLDRPGAFAGPYPSGASAIFADAVARMGGRAGYIGAVGADDFGACVADRLSADGVDVRHIRRIGGLTTGVAFVAYRGDGSRHFVFHLRQSAAAALGPDDIPADTDRVRFVHITGSALSTSPSVRAACIKAAELCKRGGGLVSFDPNLRAELLGGVDAARELCAPVLALCDVLLPSGAEANLLAGDADAAAACRRLVQGGIPVVALKRGAAGSSVFTAADEFDVPSIEVDEVDPTGAGDCYGGALITALLESWDLRRAARFANIAGALSVTRRGPMEGIPTRADVIKHMEA